VLDPFSSQIQLSNSPFFHWALKIRLNNCCFNSSSHSNISLLHGSLHLNSCPFPLFTQTLTSLSVLSLHSDMEYNLGKVSLRRNSPIHLSFQKFIILPLPSFQLIFSSNQLFYLSASQILHRSFHHQ